MKIFYLTENEKQQINNDEASILDLVRKMHTESVETLEDAILYDINKGHFAGHRTLQELLDVLQMALTILHKFDVAGPYITYDIEKEIMEHNKKLFYERGWKARGHYEIVWREDNAPGR